MERLVAQGTQAYVTPLFEAEGGLSVMHSLLSDPDCFHLARSGVVAMPCCPTRSPAGARAAQLAAVAELATPAAARQA